MKKNSENKNVSDEKQKISVKERLQNLTFYKKKRFYTILIIVFSVLLVATVITGPLARVGSVFAGFSSFGQMGSFDADTITDEDTSSDAGSSDDTSSDDSISGGEMPDMDLEDMGDISSGDLPSGSLPDSSDSSSDEAGSFDISEIEGGDIAAGGGMPSSDLSGDTSSDDSSSEDASSDDSLIMGDIASGDTADMTASVSSDGGFLSWYGSSWLIIAIILFVLDAAAIVCRIMTAKRQKKEAKEALKEQARQEGRVYIEKGPVKKEKNAKTVWIIPLCVVIAIILIVNLISSGGSTTSAQTEASDLSGTVETGTIAATVPGTGTLESEEAVDISFADGVTVTKWYVSNGDTVSEGDTLAKVDKTTVLSAIATVQEAIETLDEEIASHEDDEISDTITASSDGRIKAVYASEGTSVVDTMYESSSLIIISLDGLMAVDIETDELSRGEEVTVTLSDGSEEEGEVESVTNGVAVITLTDEGTDIGETVTVTDPDGNEIGSGELYVHSALKVTGFSGTVSDISVSEEDEVSAGDTLLTLEDTDYTAEYEALIETRTELSDQIASLFTLYATGYLYAGSDGVISGIDESLTDDDSSEDASEDTGSEDTASADATSLEASVSDISVLSADLTLTLVSTEGTQTADTETTAETGEDTSDDTLSGTESTDTDTETSSESESIVGYVTALTSNEDGSVTLTVLTTGSETKEVTLSSADTVYTFSDSAFAGASISDIQAGYLIFYDSENSQVIYISLSTSSSDQSEGDTQGESGQYSQEQSDSSSSLSDMLSGSDTSSDMTASSADTASSLTADTSTTGDVSTTGEAVETTYSVSETVLCSITPQDYMTVEITVDELDILSLSVGLSAVVTLDAYTGQSFEGEVISVSLSPTNSGGNSKYTAVIQIEKTEDMLSGMNASVSITIDETDDILVIPAAAVFEEDGAYYVYTSFDEKSGEYSGATEVTLGVSDGEYVEVTSGLSEGDEYYYSYLDTVNYSSTTITGGGGLFSFGGM